MSEHGEFATEGSVQTIEERVAERHRHDPAPKAEAAVNREEPCVEATEQERLQAAKISYNRSLLLSR